MTGRALPSADRLVAPRRHVGQDLLLAALFLAHVVSACGPRGAAGPGPRELQPGRPLHAELSQEQHHTYLVALESGQAGHVLVNQGEADLAVTVTGSADSRPRVWDAWERGVESISLLADTGGVFELRVALANPEAGPARYEISLATLHPFTPDDRRRQQAERLGAEAKPLAYDASGESQRLALEWMQQALDLWQTLDEPAQEGAAQGTIGDILYSQSQFEGATEAYRAALPLARRVGDTRYEAELLNNLGATQWRRGLLRDAARYFDEALAHWHALAFAYGEAATLTNMGLLWWEAGDYQQALDRHLEALRLTQQLGDSVAEAFVLNNIGITHRALGDYDAAVEHLERARPLFAGAGQALAESRASIALGQIHVVRGDTLAARASVTRALDAIRNAGDQVAQADAHELLGRIADREGDVREATAQYVEALGLYRAAGSRRGEGRTLHLLGAARLALDDPQLARASLEQALAIRREAGLRDAEAETLHQIALVDRHESRLADARRNFEEALAIIEDVRARVAGEYSRASYFAARQQYYASYIDLLMQLHAATPAGGHAAEAVAAVERVRARSLVELLDARPEETMAGLDPALLASRREAQEQLNFWSYRLAGLADRAAEDDRAADARRHVVRSLNEYREADTRIRASTRRARTPTAPIGVPEIQRDILDAESSLLYVSLGDAASYAWVVTVSDLRAFALAPSAEIDRAARRLYDVASNRGPPGGMARHAAEYEDATNRLASLLLAPIVSALNTPRLLIVADGVLQSVPFAALPHPVTRQPLVEHLEIALLPSASTLAMLRRDQGGRPPAPRALAVLADPVYEATDPRMPRNRPVPGQPTLEFPWRPMLLSRLPFSRIEGEAILTLVPPASRMAAFGFEASRDMVMGGALEAYRMVHFATHAVHDAIHPELSGVVLSLFDASGVPRDGFLRLHEIYGLRLSAELVVLAACRTALGREVPGEGVLGLARGFFAAGATRVVASLYDVDDEATAELMRAFYDGMLGPEQLRPGAALRAAQIRMRAQRRGREADWSAFAILGVP